MLGIEELLYMRGTAKRKLSPPKLVDSFFCCFYFVGKLGRFIQNLYDESLHAFPYIIDYWDEEHFAAEFNRLLIDDNADPLLNYSIFDSQIKERAFQEVMKNKQ